MTGTRTPDENRRIRPPSLADAIAPLIILVVLIGGSVLLFGLDEDHIKRQAWTSLPAFAIAFTVLLALSLSRPAADSATVTSPLIAWNSCGAYMGAVLGVSAFRYLPFAIFCYASPALSVLAGITGFKIEKIAPADGARPGRNRREAHGLS